MPLEVTGCAMVFPFADAPLSRFSQLAIYMKDDSESHAIVVPVDIEKLAALKEWLSSPETVISYLEESPFWDTVQRDGGFILAGQRVKVAPSEED